MIGMGMARPALTPLPIIPLPSSGRGCSLASVTFCSTSTLPAKKKKQIV